MKEILIEFFEWYYEDDIKIEINDIIGGLFIEINDFTNPYFYSFVDMKLYAFDSINDYNLNIEFEAWERKYKIKNLLK